MIEDGQLLNYIGGKWQRSRAAEYLDVRNPATARTLVRVPLTPADEVDEAARSAQAAFPDRAHNDILLARAQSCIL